MPYVPRTVAPQAHFWGVITSVLWLPRWPLHNVWHLTSCIACYYMLFHAYYYRYEKLGLYGLFGPKTIQPNGTSPSLPRPPGFSAAWHAHMGKQATEVRRHASSAQAVSPCAATTDAATTGDADAVRRSPRFARRRAGDA